MATVTIPQTTFEASRNDGAWIPTEPIQGLSFQLGDVATTDPHPVRDLANGLVTPTSQSVMASEDVHLSGRQHGPE